MKKIFSKFYTIRLAHGHVMVKNVVLPDKQSNQRGNYEEEALDLMFFSAEHAEFRREEFFEAFGSAPLCVLCGEHHQASGEMLGTQEEEV